MVVEHAVVPHTLIMPHHLEPGFYRIRAIDLNKLPPGEGGEYATSNGVGIPIYTRPDKPPFSQNQSVCIYQLSFLVAVFNHYLHALKWRVKKDESGSPLYYILSPTPGLTPPGWSYKHPLQGEPIKLEEDDIKQLMIDKVPNLP